MNGDRVTSRPVLIRQSAAGLKSFFELSKGHLSFYIALSGVAGHVLAQDHISRDSLVLGSWVLILASGSGVLNNIQDREYDRRFLRTRNRLLARRVFPLQGAWIMAFTLVGAGLAGLYFSYSSIVPVLLGTTALISYNGLYTPIKKKSPWALVPGTVCGMIPPAMGWFAVPGHTACTDLSGLMILMVCLGLWQFPHYRLVALKQSGMDKAFQTAGQARDILYQVLIWTSLFCMGVALFLLWGWVVHAGLIFLFAVAVLLPVAMAVLFFFPGSMRPELRAGAGFLIMNLVMFFFLSIIIIDRV